MPSHKLKVRVYRYLNTKTQDLGDTFAMCDYHIARYPTPLICKLLLEFTEADQPCWRCQLDEPLDHLELKEVIATRRALSR